MSSGLLFGIVAAAVIIISVPLCILDVKKKIKNIDVQEFKERQSINNDVIAVTTHAEVIDMMCCVKTVGRQNYKQPKAVKHFVIKFRDENNHFFDISVSEEMYHGFEIGLVGELNLIDGKINSFIPDDLCNKFEE